jgi:hypothetical protein
MPCTVVKPVPKAVEPILNEIFRGSKIEPGWREVSIALPITSQVFSPPLVLFMESLLRANIPATETRWG